MTASAAGGLPFRIQLDVKVPMSDGVLLSADLYMPTGRGPFPALLLHTPYDNQEEGYIVKYAKPFVESGYAVVLLDSRGRYDSGGDWYAYVNEGKDSYEAQEWIGRQSWCDGNIGTFGISYPGSVQVWAAPYHSRYLKALVPTAAQEDNYNAMAYSGGTFHLSWGWWFVIMAGRTLQIGSDKLMNKMELYRRLPLISALDDICDSPAYRDAIKHYAYDNLWKSYGVQDKYDEIEAPAYFITGWYDNLVYDNFKLLVGWKKKARSEQARRMSRLLVGPWSHGTLGTNKSFGDISFGGEAEVDLVKEHLRWYDKLLKGKDNGIDREPPIKLFVMGENVWRYENEWPIARTQYTDFYLHSAGRANSLHGDGFLDDKAPAGDEPADRYSYNPEDPVPSIGGHDHYGGEHAGPRDRRPAERRDDVLIYTLQTLMSDVEVTGPITVTLYASSSSPDTDFTATLVDVHPDGRTINITAGILRARFRESLEQPSLIEPGKIYEYKIGVWETSNVFKSGHQIRLEISSSDFPNHDRNLNTGRQPGMDAEMNIARQTIYHDSTRPSSITLPIIPR